MSRTIRTLVSTTSHTSWWGCRLRLLLCPLRGCRILCRLNVMALRRCWPVSFPACFVGNVASRVSVSQLILLLFQAGAAGFCKWIPAVGGGYLPTISRYGLSVHEFDFLGAVRGVVYLRRLVGGPDDCRVVAGLRSTVAPQRSGSCHNRDDFCGY